MNLEELQALAASGEGESLEFKGTTGQRGEACRTLCAFLNGKGGRVVFGVTDRGIVTGQEVSDKTRRELSEAFGRIEPFADVETEWVEVGGGRVAIVCGVEKGNAGPYTFEGRAYKRVESTTVAMGREEYRARLREAEGFQSDWERRPNPELRLADLDVEEVKATARRAVNAGRLDASADTEDAEGLLERFKMSRDGVLLNGAAALFGKPDLPGYPQLRLKMGWFKGADMREFMDNRHVSGHVARLMDEAMAFCFKHLNYSARVEGIEREEALEIPMAALREALINAFAHRSYENRGQTVYLAVFADRVEIRNPGSFPPDWDVGELFAGGRGASIPRNPEMAHVLYLRKSIESWGRGLGLIGEEMARAGLPMPVVEEGRGYVTATFARPGGGQAWAASGPGDPETIQKRARKGAEGNAELRERLIQAVRFNPGLPRKLLAEELGMSERQIRKILQELREIGIIVRQGADRGGRWVVTEIVGEKGLVTGGESGLDGVEKNTLKSGLKSSLNGGLKSGLNATDRQLVVLLANESSATIPRMQAVLGLSRNGVKKALSRLKTAGVVRREGPDRGGHWVVVGREEKREEGEP